MTGKNSHKCFTCHSLLLGEMKIVVFGLQKNTGRFLRLNGNVEGATSRFLQLDGSISRG